MKRAKENWIGEQYIKIEKNLRKKNSKRAYQLVKDSSDTEQHDCLGPHASMHCSLRVQRINM